MVHCLGFQLRLLAVYLSKHENLYALLYALKGSFHYYYGGVKSLSWFYCLCGKGRRGRRRLGASGSHGELPIIRHRRH